MERKQLKMQRKGLILSRDKISRRKQNNMEKKLIEQEKQEKFDLFVKGLKKKGFKVLSPEEHKKLVEGKKIVFSEQAIKDAERIIKQRRRLE